MPAPKDPVKNALWRKRIGDAGRGRKLTPEQKARQGAAISLAKTGMPRPDMRGDGNPMRRPEIAAKFTGRRNPKYTEIPNYGSAHDRLNRERGRALKHACINCGEPARQWALKHGREMHTEPHPEGKTPRKYSLDPWDYMPMCCTCHTRYDRGKLTL